MAESQQKLDATEISQPNMAVEKSSLTLYFDFAEKSIPTEYDFWKWLQGLGCTEDAFDVIDFKEPSPDNAFKPLAVTRFRSKDAYEDFLGKFGQLDALPMRIKGTDYEIPFKTSFCAYKQIRVFNVPFEMDIDKIKKFLSAYGTVISCEREKPKASLQKIFKNVVYEKLQITMDLQKDIPSLILVDESKHKVSYPGQPKSCAYCKKEGHTIKNCEKAKTKKKTWAEKVKNKNSKKQDQNLEVNEENFPNFQTVKGGSKSVVSPATTPPTTHNRFQLLSKDNVENRLATPQATLSPNKRPRTPNKGSSSNKQKRNAKGKNVKKSEQSDEFTLFGDTSSMTLSSGSSESFRSPGTPTSIFQGSQSEREQNLSLRPVQPREGQSLLCTESIQDVQKEEVNENQSQAQNSYEIFQDKYDQLMFRTRKQKPTTSSAPT